MQWTTKTEQGLIDMCTPYLPETCRDEYRLGLGKGCRFACFVRLGTEF